MQCSAQNTKKVSCNVSDFGEHRKCNFIYSSHTDSVVVVVVVAIFFFINILHYSKNVLLDVANWYGQKQTAQLINWLQAGPEPKLTLVLVQSFNAIDVST